jgi:hypothetical protein
MFESAFFLRNFIKFKFPPLHFRNNIFFGVVSIRIPDILQESGSIAITVEGTNINQKKLEIGDTFLLIESEVYFEAYRHVLKSLQSLELEQFPLAKYIVGAHKKVEPPPYLVEADETGRRKEIKMTIPLKQRKQTVKAGNCRIQNFASAIRLNREATTVTCFLFSSSLNVLTQF